MILRDNDPNRGLTDANGIYVMETLREAPWTPILYAYGKGFAPAQAKHINPGPLDNPAEVNFMLDPGHWLEGVVIDRQGQPVVNQFICVTSKKIECVGWTHFDLARTSDLGYFRFDDLPGPEVMLSLETPSQVEYHQQFVEVDQAVEIVVD